jgi:hypothetical protein
MGESDEVSEMWEQNQGDDSLISSGWSITVGELKRALESIPDDYEVMLTNAEVGDIDISNVNIDGLWPPALGSPGIFRLGGGQIVNSEYAYEQRMDVHHQVGGDKYWTTRENPDGEWKDH